MHDARHSGTATVAGPRTGTIRWQRNLGGNITPGAVIGGNGSVVVATNSGILYSLDPITGQRLWRFDGGAAYGNDLSTSAVIAPDGTIIWPGPSGILYGIDTTGRVQWTVDLGGFILSPALSPTGRLYAMTMSGLLSAIDFNASSAHIAWQVETGSGSYGSPSIGPDGTIITTGSHDVVGVTDRGTSANVSWRFPIKELIEVSPAISADGIVVVGSNDRLEYGLDAATGSLLWTVPRGDETYSSATVTSEGLAFYGDHTATLYVVDVHSGMVVRSTTTRVDKPDRSHGIWTAPAIDRDGAAYYGTRSGHVFGVGPTGKTLFDLDIGGTVDSYPAIGGDGSLYIGSSNGTMIAVSPG